MNLHAPHLSTMPIRCSTPSPDERNGVECLKLKSWQFALHLFDWAWQRRPISSASTGYAAKGNTVHVNVLHEPNSQQSRWTLIILAGLNRCFDAIRFCPIGNLHRDAALHGMAIKVVFIIRNIWHCKHKLCLGRAVAGNPCRNIKEILGRNARQPSLSWW